MEPLMNSPELVRCTCVYILYIPRVQNLVTVVCRISYKMQDVQNNTHKYSEGSKIVNCF